MFFFVLLLFNDFLDDLSVYPTKIKHKALIIELLYFSDESKFFMVSEWFLIPAYQYFNIIFLKSKPNVLWLLLEGFRFVMLFRDFCLVCSLLNCQLLMSRNCVCYIHCCISTARYLTSHNDT